MTLYQESNQQAMLLFFVHLKVVVLILEIQFSKRKIMQQQLHL